MSDYAWEGGAILAIVGAISITIGAWAISSGLSRGEFPPRTALILQVVNTLFWFSFMMAASL